MRVSNKLCVALSMAQLWLSPHNAFAQGLLDNFLFSTNPPDAVVQPKPNSFEVSTPASPLSSATSPATVKKPPVKRTAIVLKQVPLPPPRPAWLDKNSDSMVASLTQKKSSEVVSQTATPHASVAITTTPEPRSKVEQGGSVALGIPLQRKLDQSTPSSDQMRTITLIVRERVQRPSDLEGLRIALVQDDPRLDSLSELLEANAGVHLNSVSSNWSAALSGLARGDLDGVLVSIGPALSKTETAGLELNGYRLLEVPLEEHQR